MGGTVGTVGIPVGDGVTGSAVGAAVFVGAPVVGDLVGGQVDVGLGAWDGGGVVGSGVTYQDHGSTESMNCREYSPVYIHVHNQPPPPPPPPSTALRPACVPVCVQQAYLQSCP